MNEKVFARYKHNRLLLSFLFVFVGPAKRCDLKKFDCLWRAAAAGIQSFCDVKWMLTQSG
jgi:hypothetical protein